MQNMNHMLKQAQKLQQEMLKVQAELEQKEFSFRAGGDMVAVTVNGKKEVKSITLNKDVVDPNDLEMLQDLIVSAVNGAIQKANDEMNAGMKDLTKGLNLPSGFSL